MKKRLSFVLAVLTVISFGLFAVASAKKEKEALTQELKNIWVIPQTETILNEDMEKFEGYDIEKITERMIPAELKDKFKMVLNYTKI